MDLLVENVLMSGYGSAGQRCLAVSNIAVVPEIHDEFIERLLEASKNLRIGDGGINQDFELGAVWSGLDDLAFSAASHDVSVTHSYPSRVRSRAE